MEIYPAPYVVHNLPLLALSGLGEPERPSGSSNEDGFMRDQGIRIQCDLPPLEEAKAVRIREEFRKADGSSLPWKNAQNSLGQAESMRYRFNNIPRSYVFPSRKAAPPPQTPSEDPSGSPPTTGNVGIELHSPLSPLSPTSPLFPDGILTPQWIAKHQAYLPSVIISFFEIKSDSSNSSVEDSRLKNEINTVKNAILQSGFKTRYAVVLVSDKTIVAAPELEERLTAIRRATGLDPKNALFFLPPGSQTELAAFVASVLSALQPICIEYYRDLTKHARRKKNRGYVPPATGTTSRGTSQSLSAAGWNVRYEFKQGVFAEFRQEMDAAERHYSFAIDELFSSEGVLENTPIWSSRWEDARCLTDVTALRVLRCQIWRGMTTGAAESWVNYKDRMMDLVDRRGKGSGTYGWAAWESRWAEIMAQILVRADLAVYQAMDSLTDDENEDIVESEKNVTFAPAEKAFSAVDRLPPFHFLHHPGYWFRLSSRYARIRRERARALPDEDRKQPEETLPPQMADRIRRYDTYMVPAPHQEFQQSSASQLDRIFELDERAAYEFNQRKQFRAQAQTRLDQARLLEEGDHHPQIVEILQPVWQDMAWRSEKWWDLASQIISVLHKSALATKDYALATELEWERMSAPFATKDIAKVDSAHGSSKNSSDRLINLDSRSRLSPITVAFAFAEAESHIGDQAPCQIVLVNHSSSGHPSLQISTLDLEFNGNPHLLRITHETRTDTNAFQDLSVKESTASLTGGVKSLSASAALDLEPQQQRILNLAIPLRDASSYHATDARIQFRLNGQEMEYVLSEVRDLEASHWLLGTEGGIVSRRIPRDAPSSINVLPKPPKVMLRVANLEDQYFTNEEIVLDIDVRNEEVETVIGSLNVELMDSVPSDLRLRWHNETEQSDDGHDHREVISTELGTLNVSTNTIRRVCLAAPAMPLSCSFSIGVVYTLASDPDTPVSKTLTLNMAFVNPFEANYDLLPRLDNTPWPSFFAIPPLHDDEADKDKADGISQHWALATRIASFAQEPLLIDSASLILNYISSNAVCELEPLSSSTFPLTLNSKTLHTTNFAFRTTRLSLEDRRPSGLDLTLVIKWRRSSASNDSSSTTSTLSIPKLTIPGPEPRVLCTTDLTPQSDHDPNLPTQKTLTLTLENPSTHFLTFSVSVEATDLFAFSGPKLRTVSLTPVSRMSVRVKMLVYADKGDVVNEAEEGLGRGRWIPVGVRVVDSYFQKTLRVLDAGMGVRGDGRGGVKVWVAD